MDKRFVSIIVVIAVIGGLLLFQAAQSGTSRVLLPSELLAEVAGEKDAVLTKLRVAGRVTADEIKYNDSAPFRLEFRIEDPETPKGSIPVVYSDLKPDMFAEGRDVIIDGEYRDGGLVAARMLTQCPSKYEPPSGYDEGAQHPETINKESYQ